MKRHYFIGENLEDLETVQHELQEQGITLPQIHVLTNSDAELEKHHLHPVAEVMKSDVVNSGLWGLAIGVGGALLVIAVTFAMGWAETVGWTPFIFLAIVIFGFCAWEGGFLGFQEKNRRFKRFEDTIRNNRHVLLVDIEDDQEHALDDVVGRHPHLAPAGEGEPAPGWVIVGENQLRELIRRGP